MPAPLTTSKARPSACDRSKRLTPSTGLRRSGLDDLRTWEQDSSRADSVKTGVWEATPGENRSIKGETFEYCHILSGVVELTEEGKEPRIFRAGDSFVMKPGYVGVWKTIETVRKMTSGAEMGFAAALVPSRRSWFRTSLVPVSPSQSRRSGSILLGHRKAVQSPWTSRSRRRCAELGRSRLSSSYRSSAQKPEHLAKS
jgi:uncharacterized cupin superfamily protein